jgi:hypothetical protein
VRKNFTCKLPGFPVKGMETGAKVAVGNEILSELFIAYVSFPFLNSTLCCGIAVLTACSFSEMLI